MLNGELLEARREVIAASPDLSSLRDRLLRRAAPVLDRDPIVPSVKALLSSDGGVCPDDRTRLEFDPWSPSSHRCPACRRRYTGERHDRAWAHYQHLWLSERMAHLAALAALGGPEQAAAKANQLLQAYRNYLEYPNRDNVLGPSRLFFSTYLESIWVLDYLAAAMLLRESELLDEASAEVASMVADEAANLIGEYDEGFSNRQTWNNAALASIAVWFEDGELASRAIEGPTGVLAHLLQGFGVDGTWYEGDNYHLFALRGELLAMGWAREAGVDLLADDRLAGRLAAALRAPALTALPDLTFPARKDSRFGVSLAQPMYLESWEVGLARLGDQYRHDALWSWLKLLYDSPAPVAQTFDSYLHEAGETPPPRRTRADLSWWSLLEMTPALPESPEPWSPESVLFEGQGLAVLRREARYTSLECGPSGGGHGHADRLNLVLHAEGEYWLPDFGTGSYVSRDLFWYRSTLAHNAPRLDGVSQPIGEAQCEFFDASGEWAWARGSYGDLTRTVVSGPEYVLDVLELAGENDHLLELPLHLAGTVEVSPPPSWSPAELPDEFVTGAESITVSSRPVRLTACRGKASLPVGMLFDGELVRAVAPGAPGSKEPAAFFVARTRGRTIRIVTVLGTDHTAEVEDLTVSKGAIQVTTSEGTDQHTATVEGWEVRSRDSVTRLGGARRKPEAFKPLIQPDRPLLAHGVALPLADPPALDGTLDGFDSAEPLMLDHEDQYRRSEEPYAGPEEFSGSAFLNWTDAALYLAVDVIKPEVFPRDPQASPLQLDNEPDEIHGDGIQVYLRLPEDESVHGYLIVPSTENGDIIARRVSGGRVSEQVWGAWQYTETGYRITVAISPPGWGPFRPGDEIGFDLIINEMLPGRQRRAGQLVWSGGGGWVWLRGDRQDPSRFGTLELR